MSSTTVQRMPYIKVLDVTTFETPIKVMISRVDGKLWWSYAPVVPTILTTERSVVKFVLRKGEDIDRYKRYLFTQAFYNIHMYNKFKLEEPMRFFLDDSGLSFYYFMKVDVDVVIIPLLYRDPQLSIIFTSFKDRPAFKISVTQLIVRPNTKRRRRQ